MELEKATTAQLRSRLAELAGGDPEVVSATAEMLEAMGYSGSAAELRSGKFPVWMGMDAKKALVKMAEILDRHR